MQYKPELIAKLQRGEKTCTSRLRKPGETSHVWAFDGERNGVSFRAEDIMDVRHPNGSLKWMVGNTYAVQPGRGQKAVGRQLLRFIEAADVRHYLPLGAAREGFESLNAFWDYWCQIHHIAAYYCSERYPNLPLWRNVWRHYTRATGWQSLTDEEFTAWFLGLPEEKFAVWRLGIEYLQDGA